jgi:uncharacterized protein YhhL (DUF1145 family)
VLPKAMIIVVWIACLGAFALPAGTLASILGRGIFWFMIVVHTVECAVFLPQLRRAGGSLGNHLLQTFLFGVFHLRSVRQSAAESGATP